MDLRTSRVFELNKTAARVWELLGASLTPEQIVSSLSREYLLTRARSAASSRGCWGSSSTKACSSHDADPSECRSGGPALPDEPASDDWLTLQLASKRPDVSRAREGCVWRDLDGSARGRSLIAGDQRSLEWFDVGVLAFN